MISSQMEILSDSEDDKPPNKCFIKNESLYSETSSITSNDNIGTFGKVSKLSNYLKPDWWSNLFNENYLKTDGDIVENEQITKNEIDIIISIMKKFNIHQKSKILDICCGQGRHLMELSKMNYSNLFGIDYSNFLLEIAKKRNNEIKFIKADIRNIPLNETFDFIQMIGNSFGYFTNFDDNIKVLQEIYRLMNNETIFLLDITNGEFMINEFDKNIWSWIDNKTIVCRERELSNDKQKLISREIIIDLYNFKVIDQFYSEYIFNLNSIKSILENNLFNVLDVILYDVNLGEHKDEGMMEKRYFIICKKIEKKSV